MKRKLLYGIGTLSILILLGYAYWHYEFLIHQKILNLQLSLRDKKESKLMNANLDSIKSLPNLSDEEGAWYTQYHFIAHGGGGLDGKTYSNSLEAMNNSYENGLRVYDIDLDYTKDSILVCCHSWLENLEQSGVPMMESKNFVDRNGHTQHHINARPLDYKTFKSRKVYRQYTPMSSKDLLLFMLSHSDVYVAPDMKADVVSSYQYLVDRARELKADSVLDRIIVNVYDYDIYNQIMKIYPFKNTTARQHHVHPNNYYELAKFCISNHIHVVNISSCYVNDEGAKLLMSKGIHLYVAVVDYHSDMEKFKEQGYSGACTNWLKETDWDLKSNNI
jgi:glycerophosphoryl diester phosphodiesterase